MKQNVSPQQDLKTKNNPSKSLLGNIQQKLSQTSSSPYLDALVLLGHISGKSKSDLLTHPSPDLTPEQYSQLEDEIHQILSGIPLPYVLGNWEFYQLSFQISPDVLIPRPETEGLVEKALQWLEDHPAKRKVLEVGTGSGCIAISLAKNNPELEIQASELSQQALDIALGNAQRHQVQEQIWFHKTHLLEGIKTKVDLLIANLPYIPTKKLLSLSVFHTEPQLALDGGEDGLSLIRETLEAAPGILHPGGVILLELDEDCGPSALTLGKTFFPDATVNLDQDLSGMDRYLVIQT